LVEASLKKKLRDLSQYNVDERNDAANYLLAENISLDEALTYANKSL
jgi:hypothetical protein